MKYLRSCIIKIDIMKFFLAIFLILNVIISGLLFTDHFGMAMRFGNYMFYFLCVATLYKFFKLKRHDEE